MRLAPVPARKWGPTLTDGDVARAFLHPDDARFALAKLESLAPLMPGERQALSELAGRADILQPRDEIHARDGQPDSPILLLSGCLRQSVTDAEGRVQTLSLHWPGDVVGLAGWWSERHVSDLDALALSKVARLPPARHDALGRLPHWIERLAHGEAAMAMERLRLLGRGRAEERVTHLLLECNARQRRVLPGLGDRAWIPFSQTEIANATGLTNVYVSKTLTSMRERGIVGINADVVTLHDRERAVREVDFIDPIAGLRPPRR